MSPLLTAFPLDVPHVPHWPPRPFPDAAANSRWQRHGARVPDPPDPLPSCPWPRAQDRRGGRRFDDEDERDERDERPAYDDDVPVQGGMETAAEA